MWEFIKSILILGFWVEPFPEHKYAAECFDCKKSDCMGCEFLERK